MSEYLLEVKDLCMRFGGLLAVDNVGFNVRPQEVFAIIGPNGAGKTTVFNCISGFYQPSGGSVVLDGQSIAGHSSHQVANHGVVRTFQNVRLFKSMTALENLLVAQHRQSRTTLLGGLFNTPGYRRAEQEKIDNALQWLDVMGLRQFANREAGNLAYGHQRRLEMRAA
jgi:branched-chain amino acid transport system ATP-binding protein